jgi:hypothetical protein
MSHDLDQVNARISEINAKLAELTKAREAIDNGDKERIAAQITKLRKERERAVQTGASILKTAEAEASARARQMARQRGKYIG